MQGVSQKDYDSAQRYSTELDAQLWRLSQQMDDQTAAKKAKAAKDDPKATAQPVNKAQPTDQHLPTMIKNLAIMSLELRASILIHEGKITDAEALFAQAHREEHDLGYHEPPAFIQPVAELQAQLLASAGKSTEAEKAWKQALEDRPKSGFPLYGLAELSEQSNDTAKTSAAYNEFLAAWKTADPTLPQIQHAQQWIVAHPNQALASAK
jgi:tetratricopeptide (TPR) repeat protein